MSEALADIRNTDKNSFTVKQMEKMKDDLEVKLSKLLESPKRDDVIDFEQLGVDKLFVDEAHLFKSTDLIKIFIITRQYRFNFDQRN